MPWTSISHPKVKSNHADESLTRLVVNVVSQKWGQKPRFFLVRDDLTDRSRPSATTPPIAMIPSLHLSGLDLRLDFRSAR